MQYINYGNHGALVYVCPMPLKIKHCIKYLLLFGSKILYNEVQYMELNLLTLKSLHMKPCQNSYFMYLKGNTRLNIECLLKQSLHASDFAVL
jgi:hypothetical protein